MVIVLRILTAPSRCRTPCRRCPPSLPPERCRCPGSAVPAEAAGGEVHHTFIGSCTPALPAVAFPSPSPLSTSPTGKVGRPQAVAGEDAETWNRPASQTPPTRAAHPPSQCALPPGPAAPRRCPPPSRAQPDVRERSPPRSGGKERCYIKPPRRAPSQPARLLSPPSAGASEVRRVATRSDAWRDGRRRSCRADTQARRLRSRERGRHSPLTAVPRFRPTPSPQAPPRHCSTVP